MSASAIRIFAAALVWVTAATVPAQKSIEWPEHGADLAATRYSPADLINAENIHKVDLAWEWDTHDGEMAKQIGFPVRGFNATPIMIHGVIYVPNAHNVVHALNAATGAELWSFDPKTYERGRSIHRGFSNRGVAYWKDGEDERVFIATNLMQLYALNAKTGKPIEGFGDGGWIDLYEGLDREFGRTNIGIANPPIICRDTVIVGSMVNDNIMLPLMPPGHVRGYDARTGKRKWIFHTIPQAGEYGNETWENESWKNVGSTNVWTTMSADEELGFVYLPTSTPSGDYYGGHRLGDNLFAESLVCLNAETGERVWHFQAVHHGIWDYDFPCAPNLIDISVGGKRIKAVAQVSKQAFTYVFDRVTGKPFWPIEERPVLPSTVPGERLAPTQPFPTRPPAFDLQGVSEDTLIDFTPELRAEALEIIKNFAYGGLFHPTVLPGQDGKRGTIQVPSAGGGANWGGASVDPESGVLFVPSETQASGGTLRESDPAQTGTRYTRGAASVAGPRGLPLLKPPYTRFTAIDMNTGEFLWQVPVGEGPREKVAAIMGRDPGPLGDVLKSGLNSLWTMCTKTLAFVVRSTRDENNNPNGWINAYNKQTGAQVWERRIEKQPFGAPMTYVHEGKQYILLAVTDREKPRLMAFALKE